MLINTGAPAAPANPAGAAAAAGAGPPKNQSIVSNAALYARLAAARSEQDLQNLFNDKTIAERLEKSLLYYKVEERGAIERDVGSLALRFAQKEELTASMKELVLVPFAVACQLEATSAFNLLDSYFQQDHRQFFHFDQVNKRVNDFAQQIQQQLPQGNFFAQQAERQRQYDAYDEELKRVASRIVTGVKAFYLMERRALLRCHVILISLWSSERANESANRPNQPRAAARDFLKSKLLGRGKFPANVARSLQRCQHSESQEFRRYFDNSDERGGREQLSLAVQEEQIEMLKILFSLFYADSNIIKDDSAVADTMISYLVESSQIGDQAAHQMQHLPMYAGKESIRAGLTQLVCLAMLQLHRIAQPDPRAQPLVTDPRAQPWNMLVSENSLSLVTGPITLAILASTDSRDDAIARMKRKISDLAMTAIRELLCSEVFLSDELQAMNDAFYLVLYGWLIKAFGFFVKEGLGPERGLVEDLTLRVFRNPSIIQRIWAEIPDRQDMEDIGRRIEIFERIVTRPTEDTRKFLQLILVLSGSRRQPQGTCVLEMLQGTAVKEESNLLAELVAFLAIRMNPSGRGQLELDELERVQTILILFAKVIKQDPRQYQRLNSCYMDVADSFRDDRLGLIFERSAQSQGGRNSHGAFVHYRQPDFEQGNHPFLALMVRALHSLMTTRHEDSRDAIAHIIDALSALFDCDALPLKQDIIGLLERYADHELGGATIASHFGGVVLAAEARLCNFKATESFLRFLSKCFKRTYPQECLPEGLPFDQSVLARSLDQVYAQLVAGYFQLQFADAAAMGRLTARLLKLTRILLNHFNEVPQSQKAPLCEPMPGFDVLLATLKPLLDGAPVQRICLKALELAQVEERRPEGTVTRFENRHLHDASKLRLGNSNQVAKLVRMVNEAIQVLNKLLQLALVDDSTGLDEDGSLYATSGIGARMNNNLVNLAQDWTSKRCQYIRDLRCVQQFRSHVLEPTRALQSVHGTSSYGHSVSLSLQSQIAHYISPGARMDNSQVRTSALDHLTLSCRLWESALAGQVRPDLCQLLQGLGALEAKFFPQLENSFGNGPRSQCLAYLDLLIVSAQSQPAFLEMFLGDDKSERNARLCNAIVSTLASGARANILAEEQSLHIKFKFVTLLSLLAKKRICLSFLSFKESLFLRDSMQHVIEAECLRRITQEKISLGGRNPEAVGAIDENPRSQSNLASRKVANQCLAKVTICLFLQLLVSEFSREPTRPAVRRLITSLFTNEHFKTLSIPKGQVSPDVHNLMTQMRNLNGVLQSPGERSEEHQRQNWDLLATRGVDMQLQSSSPLHSRDGSIHLKGNLCINLFKVLQKKELAEYIVNPGADLVEVSKSHGRLGRALYVSTTELGAAMRNEFYASGLIGQATALCGEFNLALSLLMTDHLILRAKQDFMVSIGKIALRESQAVSKAEYLIPMSLFPLISHDVVPSAGPETFKKHSSALTKLMLIQAEDLLKQILARKHGLFASKQSQSQQSDQSPENYFLTKLDQDVLAELVFTLGVVSSQMSSTRGSLQVDIKADLERIVQQEILMRIHELVDVEKCLFDVGMIAQEVSVDLRRHGVQNAANLKAIESSEQHKYETFIQLVTQCFQLCIRLKEEEEHLLRQHAGRHRSQQPPRQVGANRASVLERSIENAYIKVLAQVLDGMRRNYCFLRGLKVFVLAVQLIEGDDCCGFSRLMKKEEDQPMKVIIGRLLESDVTDEEITTILQLFTNYASTRAGAIHLSGMQVLDSLFRANIMQRLNEQDAYISRQKKNWAGQTSQQQVRNPAHVHWCQVLLLIRTMNEHLTEDPAEHGQYFSALVRAMHHFKQRIPKVLHIGLTLAAQATQQLDQMGNRSIQSMALLEEIELLCAVMQQTFEHSDTWASLAWPDYCELKDYTLFAVTGLLQLCDASAIIPASVTEQHLAKVTQQTVENNRSNQWGNAASSRDREMTAFQLKVEISLQKTFLSVTCSLLNTLVLSKTQQGRLSRMAGSDLVQTWNPITGREGYANATNESMLGLGRLSHQPHQSAAATSGVFSEDWLSVLEHEGGSPIGKAFEMVRDCQTTMLRRYTVLKTKFDRNEVQALYKSMQNIFRSDDEVQREYSGGFNAHVVADEGLEDVFEIAEAALQVSGQVAAMLLEKVRERAEPFANASYYQVPSSVGAQAEGQQAVFMANGLLTHLKEVDKECRAAQQDRSDSDNVFSNEESRERQGLDANYIGKLQNFVELMKEQSRAGYYQDDQRQFYSHF